ncbi:hypothetical protein F5X99DRAFT_367776 [Biscogniauxia marginata]|nr:hypothetical protein F5X99DRAFT_367776 [Biscogniauxia marginata]
MQTIHTICRLIDDVYITNMAEIRHDRNIKPSKSWSDQSSSLLGCLFLLIITFRLLVYLFRHVGNLKTPWSNSQERHQELEEAVELELCYKENRRLAEIWELSDKSNVRFIAFDLRTCDENEQMIADIGISPWSPDNKSHDESYHLFIDRREQHQDDTAPSGLGAFLYWKTQLIKESDIRVFISDRFNGEALGYETVCLVGHDISNKIEFLKPYWNVPLGTLIFDTQKIWKAQHMDISDITLEQCLLGIPVSERKKLLGNAGNRARAIIQLLRAQGSRSTSMRIPKIQSQG